MKILHVLETSAPELVGYTIRGRYIVNHQRQLGFDPIVATSPIFRGATTERCDDIDGIRHYRSNHIPWPNKNHGRLVSYWMRTNMLRRYRKFVAQVGRNERPDVIHAHFSYTNGVAARYASRQLGVPFVYELRTLPGGGAVIEDGLDPNSLKYRMVWRLELEVMRQADVVVAISQGLRDAIVHRGIDPGKILIVPNGVDTSVFVPRPPDQDLLRSLNLAGCFVVGFIGSLRRLEGMADIVTAFREIHRRQPKARLLVVGEGPERKRLMALAVEAGVGDAIHFTGLVPHDQILNYYSVMDVLVYPRVDAQINQAVTPLKPLEAMAMGKVCVASDVGGLKELIEHNVTGLLFKAGAVSELIETILTLESDTALRHRLAEQASRFVRADREWSIIASRYNEVYSLAKARARDSRPQREVTASLVPGHSGRS
jgi:glycogen(starch) synthase